MIQLIESILTIIILAGLFTAVFYGILIWIRTKIRFKRSLDMVYLKILIPKQISDSDEKKEITKDAKEYISIMEQLLASFKALYSPKIKAKILGQEYISLEYVAHKNEIFFYIVAPRKAKTLIEKQITGFYPDAIIESTQEINIFDGNRKHYSCTTLYPKRKFLYPIKTYQKLESDPINTITNALSKMTKDESSAIQILLQPTGDTWQDIASSEAANLQKNSFRISLNPLKWIIGFFTLFLKAPSEEKENTPENSTSDLMSELHKSIDEKSKKSGFKVCMRVVTTGPSQRETENQLKNITSAFQQFSAPNSNAIKASIYHIKAWVIRKYILRQFPLFSKKTILNTEEIASLFHFPHSKYNRTPEIKWQNFKVVKAPVNTADEGLYLGENLYRGARKKIFLKNEDRFRHFYVVGQTGTGKSSILQVMARQDLINGKGIAVMDPHGDLAADLLPYIPRERADDVIYFNPGGDKDRPMGLNMLEVETEEDKETVSMEAMNIMIKLFGNEIFGPRIQDYFRNGALTLMDYPGGGTLGDIMPLFTNEAFQKERRKTCKNPIVKSWWDNTYDGQADREKKEIIPYFQAKFSGFTTNATMKNIIGQTKSSFSIEEAMNTGKILMINLAKGELGEFNANLLGLMIVSKIQMAAMKRQKIEKSERRDFFLYIDEFQNFVTDSIESILSEARKYRLGLILAHQYIGQLEKSDALTKSNLNLKDAIFGNVGSMMSYKVGPEDGETLEKQFEPNFTRTDLVNVDSFKAAIKIAVDGQPSPAFSLNVDQPWIESNDPMKKTFLKPGDENLAKAYIELSRLKYGRAREFIEKEINFRIGA